MSTVTILSVIFLFNIFHFSHQMHLPDVTTLLYIDGDFKSRINRATLESYKVFYFGSATESFRLIVWGDEVSALQLTNFKISHLTQQSFENSQIYNLFKMEHMSQSHECDLDNVQHIDSYKPLETCFRIYLI